MSHLYLCQYAAGEDEGTAGSSNPAAAKQLEDARATLQVLREVLGIPRDLHKHACLPMSVLLIKLLCHAACASRGEELRMLQGICTCNQEWLPLIPWPTVQVVVQALQAPCLPGNASAAVAAAGTHGLEIAQVREDLAEQILMSDLLLLRLGTETQKLSALKRLLAMHGIETHL